LPSGAEGEPAVKNTGFYFSENTTKSLFLSGILNAANIALTSWKIHYRVASFLGLRLNPTYNFVVKFIV
jgi:hypothetical protein